jgi:hypothetical protein
MLVRGPTAAQADPPPRSDTADTAQVIIRPPIAWALAVLAGLALNWLMPLPFVPGMVPAGWLGATVFALALLLVAWAIATMTRTDPIYLGMFLGFAGLAIAFDNLWLPATLVPFALVIRYGVVAREEAYLERKFGDVYRHYRARVRRWL